MGPVYSTCRAKVYPSMMVPPLPPRLPWVSTASAIHLADHILYKSLVYLLILLCNLSYNCVPLVVIDYLQPLELNKGQFLHKGMFLTTVPIA